ncbi:hypothetical protein ACVJBD_006451 [Rhizobium mongolense]
MLVEVVGQRPRFDRCSDTHFVFQRGVAKTRNHFDNVCVYTVTDGRSAVDTIKIEAGRTGVPELALHCRRGDRRMCVDHARNRPFAISSGCQLMIAPNM